MDGFINLLKPPGMTSSDAVLMVRKLLPRGVKVGHGGTLDPDAAGVLPICVGRATRLFDYMIDKEKEYVAEVCLGVATDTQDASGRVVARGDGEPGRAAIEDALGSLTGDILQTPPAYSAIKQGGKRLYALAREGHAVQAQARVVHVNALDYLCKSGYNRHMVRVLCRKGVYVRTLMNDLGQMLGCGGHMSFLLRTRAGAFAIADAMTPEELVCPGTLERRISPMDFPLSYLPEIRVDGRFSHAIQNGNPLPDTQGLNQGVLLRVYMEDAFAGIAQADGNGALRFRAMLL